MKNRFPFIAILSLAFSVTGFIFSLKFQSMAYGGPNGDLMMKWYWTGAVLSYVLSLFALLVMLLKVRELSAVEMIIRYLSATVVTISFFFTTFIILAWKSGL